MVKKNKSVDFSIMEIWQGASGKGKKIGKQDKIAFDKIFPCTHSIYICI
jgi:hypothetical protein